MIGSPGGTSNPHSPVNSRVSCHWTTWKELVEQVGVEPTTTSLQGISAARCLSHGGPGRTRTGRLGGAIAALSQMSYGPVIGGPCEIRTRCLRNAIAALSQLS